MTWKSHAAIATAITLPFNPIALPVAIAGSTAPDWLEWVLKYFRVRVAHRGVTHYLIIPLAIILFSFLFDYQSFIFWFGMGYLSHWIADSLTITGVPISPLSLQRVTLLGGKIRTGEPIEYIFAFGLLAIALMIAPPIDRIMRGGRDDFNQYFVNNRSLFDKKIIDQKEAVERRFKWF
jgi:inner membrane protein